MTLYDVVKGKDFSEIEFKTNISSSLRVVTNFNNSSLRL